MKIIAGIAIILFSVIGLITVLDSLDIIEIHTCLTEWQENGGSEKDTSENSEDDPETNSFSAMERMDENAALNYPTTNVAILRSDYFKDVSVPPPDFI